MTLRLDPWQPEFGAEIAAFDEPAESAEAPDVGVEVPSGEWRPIAPADTDGPAEVWFLDGVRRIDARVTVQEPGRSGYGAFGAFAVGAVRRTASGVEFADHLVGRVLAVPANIESADALALSPELTYLPVRFPDAGVDAPSRAIHGEMRKAEEAMGRELAAVPGRLVITDGPLSFEEPSRGAAVGFIKRIVQIYLPPDLLPVLAALPPSHRTPLFALRGSRRFSRITWFLRLAAPRAGDSEFSGIVRLEVAESVGVEPARALADSCGRLLPGLASRRGLDLRAPQNLLPIGALERSLRRRLGDERVVRRKIESFLMTEAQHELAQ